MTKKHRARILSRRRAELNEWYTIPEGAENTADMLIEAFLCYRYCNQTELESLPIVGRAELPVRTEPLAEETKALVVQYIADNQQALELLHEASSIEHGRYPVDFSVDFGYQMYHLAVLRRVIRLLNLDMVLHAENSNTQLAARSVTSAFGITRSLAKEPTAASQFVRIACHALRQDPVQAQNREDLKKLLKVAGGGIVFTTIQKFSPDEGSTVYERLSERKNIVVIADEAHRSHYAKAPHAAACTISKEDRPKRMSPSDNFASISSFTGRTLILRISSKISCFSGVSRPLATCQESS